MTSEKLTWDNAADLHWAESFEDLGLAESTVGADVIEDWLREILSAMQESGRGAEELFGSPADALRDHIAVVPAENRAAVDLSGQAPINLIGTGLTSVGLLATLMSIVYFVKDGWQLDVTATALWVVAAGLVLGLGGCLVWAWRTAGRAVLSTVTALVMALAMSGAVIAAVRLNNEASLFKLPTLVLTAAGLTLMIMGWNLPVHTPRVDDRSSRWSADQWFVRLEGLLRGRYHLSGDVVRGHIQEAQSYVDEHGANHPFEQFGAPETYALALTENDPAAKLARRRTTQHLWFLAAGVSGIIAVSDIFASDGIAGTVVFGVVSVLCAWRVFATRE